MVRLAATAAAARDSKGVVMLGASKTRASSIYGFVKLKVDFVRRAARLSATLGLAFRLFLVVFAMRLTRLSLSVICENALPGCRSSSTASVGTRVARAHRPSTSAFASSFFEPQLPVVLTGMMDDWPALSGSNAWSMDSFLRRTATGGDLADLLVSVEVGDSYASAEVVEMYLRDYVELVGTIEALRREEWGGDCDDDGSPLVVAAQGPGIDKVEVPSVYVAQFKLDGGGGGDAALAALAADCPAPAFAVAAQLGRGDDWGRHLFFGHRATCSPIHMDPYHNVLSQVAGRKRVRLFAPEHAPRLHLAQDHLRKNTSQIPAAALVEEKDRGAIEQRFPGFLQVPYEETVLEPGEQLFLPKGWFHWCYNETLAMSVNAWWL